MNTIKANDIKVLEQKLYIPSTFNLFESLPQKERKHIDKYAFFPHYLYMSRIFHSSLSRTDYVPIHSHTMHKFVTGRRYQTIKNFWINAGVIETNGSWLAKEFSQGYRFTKEYRNVKSIDTTVFDENFGKRMVTLRMKNTDNLDNSLPQNAYILRNLQDIKIDTKRAYTSLLAASAANPLAIDKYNKIHQSIHAIDNKEWFCTRDAKGRRMHNNYVNLSNDVKPYVYLQHDVTASLYNLDISSSQPLLLAALLVKEYGLKLPTDAAEYKAHCEDGTLYKFLMEKMNMNHLTKKEFKKKVFTWFYSKNTHVINSTEFIEFSNIFPSVAKFITDYKQDNYKALAHAMQRLEADIVIDDVVNTLATQQPNSWALTVHDSVTTTSDMVDVVYNLLKEGFEKRGVNPTITIDKIN
jgi:hypothetical protein